MVVTNAVVLIYGHTIEEGLKIILTSTILKVKEKHIFSHHTKRKGETMNEKKKKIYERNPDTGEVREREFNDFTGETIRIIHDKKPEDYGTAKMIPAYNPDPP